MSQPMSPEPSLYREGSDNNKPNFLRAALAYADRGIPVFPLRSGGKEPVIPKCPEAKAQGLVGEELASHARHCSRDGHGFHDATTDPRKIHAWGTRWPDANIGIPTGERSGLLVLDVDPDKGGHETLDEWEGKGNELPLTTVVTTGGGGVHLIYRYPPGSDIRNSAGKLGPGLDIRGEGGYVVAPPSVTEAPYKTLHKRPLADAPQWLLEALRQRQKPVSADKTVSPGRVPLRNTDAPDGPVPDGSRNDTLKWKCYGWHQDGLSDGEVEALALAFNDEWCRPSLPKAVVVRTARSMCRYPIRKKRKEVSPEAKEGLESLWEEWYEEMLPRGGRSKRRDCVRVLLEAAEKHGELLDVIIEGEIRKALAVSLSTRQGGKAAGTSHVTFWKMMCSLEEEDQVMAQSRYSGTRLKDDEPETWLIFLPATRVNTPSISSSGEKGNSVTREDVRDVNLRRGPEKTPTFRWRHPVGNARGGTLVAVEMFGPQTAEELAEIMGYSRVRDFKRKHLDALVKRGDLVEADGLYTIPHDYAEQMQAERHAPYHAFRRRRTTVEPRSGNITHWVEYGPETSDAELEERYEKRYKEQRRKLRERLERRNKKRAYQDPANSPEELLEVPKNLVPTSPPAPAAEPIHQEREASPEEHRSSKSQRVVVPFIGPTNEVLTPTVKASSQPATENAAERAKGEDSSPLEHQELEARGLAVGSTVVHTMWGKGTVMGWEAGYVWAHFGQDRCLRKFFDGCGLIRDAAADSYVPTEEMALAGVGA